jgi:hypothetical protein
MAVVVNTTQRSSGGSVSYNGQVSQIDEYVPELFWPNSNRIYTRMRRDAKCASVLRAMTLPIQGTQWHVVDSDDVRPEVSQFVRTNLGLFESGQSRRRPRGIGISWDEFLRMSLLDLVFGHMFFERVYAIAQPTNEDQGLPPKPGGYAYLSRMAPILPLTITGINIDNSGELASVKQWVQSSQDQPSAEVTIPAQFLLAFINEREGSDWTGQSVLRAAYKNWYIKDQLERLSAMITERNGMGLPVYKYGQDGDRQEAMRAATAARAGEQSGIALPVADDFKLLGVEGTLVDPLPLLVYHNQEIGKSLNAMFLDLGHDAGARNLGETFVDFFTLGINSIISDIEETMTEHLSRDLVELNFGTDEPYPEIMADDITPQASLTEQGLALLVQAGIIQPDEALQSFTRDHFGLPPTNPEGAEPETDLNIIPVAGGGGGGGGGQ